MGKSLQFYFGILLFSIIISIPLILPYLHQGYFPTHDGEWAVVRLTDMFRELKDFQIPPRYSGNLNFGYGYPLFNFAYPFPYYVGVIIHLLGFGFVDSIKILFAISVPLSAFFMFLASRKIWGNDWAGIVSATLYLYFPYRLVDLFVRGSLGESFAFALFPIIIYCLVGLLEKPHSAFFKIIGVLSYAALIMSHNIMAVLFSLSLFTFFIGVFISKKTKIIGPFAFVIGFGFLLSAFFWIPAMLEKSNILLSQIPIADRDLYFVNFRELLFDSWGYGVPTEKNGGFTYQLGWPFLIAGVTMIGLVVFKIVKKIKQDSSSKLALVLFAGTFLFSLLLFRQFWFVWRLPILSEINYPWTVLSQLGLLISLLAGFLTKFKYTRALAFGAAALALFLYIPLAKPETYINKGDNFYLTNDATTTSSKELMPLWVGETPDQRPASKVEIIKGEGKIENIFHNSRKTSFTANFSQKGIVRINTIYYPGWEVFVNGKRQTISYQNKKGVMEFPVSKGASIIDAKFGETPQRMISNIISLVAIALLFVFGAKSLLKKKK